MNSTYKQLHYLLSVVFFLWADSWLGVPIETLSSFSPIVNYSQIHGDTYQPLCSLVMVTVGRDLTASFDAGGACNSLMLKETVILWLDKVINYDQLIE